MFTGPVPPAVNYGTWVEQVYYTDIEDEQPIDFSLVDEIRVQIVRPGPGGAGAAMLELRKSTGEVTAPAPGLIEWRAESDQMNGLPEGTYNFRIIVENEDDTLVLAMSSISLIGY